jgi:hypothetical protein
MTASGRFSASACARMSASGVPCIVTVSSSSVTVVRSARAPSSSDWRTARNVIAASLPPLQSKTTGVIVRGEEIIAWA